MEKRKLSLTAYLNSLQSGGRYTFTREEAISALGVTANAFRFAALRLIKKQRLIRPKQGFYVIIPTEYMRVGTTPPTWFIDSLMKLYNQPYYVGLLSAAALHGAAHQQPQVFQVITNKPIRPIAIGALEIQFLTKKLITPDSHQSMKTPAGYLQVSIPEITAIDLVHYVKSSGYLSHVATTLSELHEGFNEERLMKILANEKIQPTDIQRLGFLLEMTETKPNIILLLKQWLKNKKNHTIPLRSDKDYDETQKNATWNLYINEHIEMDL